MSRAKREEMTAKKDASQLEEELLDIQSESSDRVSAIRALMDQMASMQQRPRLYVRSYPACNSEP